MISYIALSFSIVGALCVSGSSTKLRRRGFKLWMISNLMWLQVTWGDAPQTMLWIFYLIMSYIGWRNNDG